MTENGKDLSELSLASMHCIEPLIDMKIWDLNINENQQETASKYYHKFEALKQSQLDNNKTKLALDDSSEIEEDEILDCNMEYSEINKISSPLNPHSYSKLSHSLEEHHMPSKCVTEPDESCIVRPLFSESNLQYSSNNSNPKTHQGFMDLRYSNLFVNSHMPSFYANSNCNSNYNSKGNCNNKHSFGSTQNSSQRILLSNNYNSNEDDESNDKYSEYVINLY